MNVFFDTWGWLTLGDRNEAKHGDVESRYRDIRRNGGLIYTTDYVLDETITLLFSRLPFGLAKNSIESLQKGVRENYVSVERITRDRFEKAKGLRVRFHDKPKISFTDLTSMVVMEELGLDQILTGDAHFAQVGMGFSAVP